MPCHEKLVAQVSVCWFRQVTSPPAHRQAAQANSVPAQHSSGRSPPAPKTLALVESATRGRDKDHINGINSVPFFYSFIEI